MTEEQLMGQCVTQQLDKRADGQRLDVSTKSTRCTMRAMRHRCGDAEVSLICLEQTVTVTVVM